MNISESLQSALDSINMNKVRSALTMLGIIIGVASVIALVSLGEGFGNNITTEFSAQGAELLTVATERDVSQGYETLTLADLTALGSPAQPCKPLVHYSKRRNWFRRKATSSWSACRRSQPIICR